MAHFAELDSNNVVIRTVVVSNTDVDNNGGDYSTEAESFVASLIPYSENGVAWKQTSYNNNSRKQYASEGYTYDATKNIFIAPKPYNSWVLNSNNDWEPNIANPVDWSSILTEDGTGRLYPCRWNETDLRWEYKNTTTNQFYAWDADNSVFVTITTPDPDPFA